LKIDVTEGSCDGYEIELIVVVSFNWHCFLASNEN